MVSLSVIYGRVNGVNGVLEVLESDPAYQLSGEVKNETRRIGSVKLRREWGEAEGWWRWKRGGRERGGGRARRYERLDGR